MAAIVLVAHRLVLVSGVALAAAVVAAVAAAGPANAFAYTVFGDANPNVIEIRSTSFDEVEFCVDGLCFAEPKAFLESVIVEAYEGDDVVIVDHSVAFVTNGTGALVISVNAGTGDDRVQVCPAGCGGIDATTWAPNPTAGDGRLSQQAGTSTTDLVLASVVAVSDGSDGTLAVDGTTGDDAITFAAGEAGSARIGVTGLTPYEFSAKSSLTLRGGEGADRIELANPGVPALAADCHPAAGTQVVCVHGEAGAGDRLVAHGTAGAADAAALTPLADGAGTLAGLAAGSAGYDGVEAIDLGLQYGTEGDRLGVVGTAGDDLLEVRAGTVPGSATIQGALDRAGSPFPLPATTVTGANTTDAGLLDFTAVSGADELVLHGTARNDAFTLTPGAPDALRHELDGQLAHLLTAQGFARYVLEGGDGDDRLTTTGDAGVPTDWRAGAGRDVLASAGSGTSRVDVDLAAGSVQQAGFAAFGTSDVEVLDVSAGGNSLTVRGDASGETFRYTPTAADAGTFSREGDSRTLMASGVAQVLTIDPLGGSDTVLVLGTPASDDIPVVRAAVLTVQVGATLPARITAESEAVSVLGAAGEDRFLVSGSGGPPSFTVEGGSDAAADRLDVTPQVTDAAVTLSAGGASGLVEPGGPAIGFAQLEAVALEGDSTGTLTVRGSTAEDVISQLGNAVTVDAGARIAFTGFPTLTLDASSGSDQVHANPKSTAGVTRIVVAGGEAADTATVNGTTLGERLTYRPTGVAAAEVIVAGAPPVELVSTEAVVVDGRTGPPSADTLVVDSTPVTGTLVLEPGTTADSGALRFADGAAPATATPPLTFGGLGGGAIHLTDDGGRLDALSYRGQSTSDVFSVDSAGTVRLNAQVPVHTNAVHTLRLEGLDGSDTFNVPVAHSFPGADGGPGVVTDGAGPDSGDVLRVAAAANPATVDYGAATVSAPGSAATRYSGVERIHVDAPADVAVLGGAGPDVLRYTPTAGTGGTVTRDGDPAELRLAEVGGALTIDGADGADRVAVHARSTDDATAVTRGDPTVVEVSALLPVSLPAATEALELLAGDGADTTVVTGTGGPASLTIAGGGPTGTGDRLVLVSPSAAVTYDVLPTNGLLETPGGAISFGEMETLDVDGDGTGMLVVRGTNDADTVTLGNAVPPQVRVNGGAIVEHNGYPTLQLDGRGGQDAFSVSYLTLGDPTLVEVLGGDPATTDELVVEDEPGVTRTLRVEPAAADAGLVTLLGHPTAVRFAATESLVLDGRLGDDELQVVTPSGVQSAVVTPGATDDAGEVRVEALVPVRFQRLGAGVLRLVDADGARVDSATYAAGAASDTFDVAAVDGSVRLNARVPFVPDSVAALTLNAFDGDDAFTATGPLPFTTLRTDGSGPDSADSLTMIAATGPVTVDLGAATLSGYGGSVQFPGVEQLATDVSGQTLTEVGTTLDDALCYDPLGMRDGRAWVTGSPGGGGTSTTCAVDQRGANTLHTFTDVAELVLDPAAGTDEVIVNGTVDDDLVTMHLTAPLAEVTVHPNPSDPLAFRLVADVVVATTEKLVVATDNGADVIDVTAYDNAAPVVFVDAEGPDTRRFGDELRVRDGTGKAHMSDVGSTVKGSGTVFVEYRRAGGALVRIDYTNVEEVTLYRDSKTS